MAKKQRKQKPIKYEDVLYKLKQGYFASRACMYQREIEVIEIAIAGGMITDRKELLMLKAFDFDVVIPDA